ncbi:hypothetical protein BHE74_00054566 [Ensete ventricosum]|nr:hypothetical protein BHE74_00054566 [Ensete ventricosum]
MAPFVAPDDIDLENRDDERRPEDASDHYRIDDLVPLLVEPTGDHHQQVLPPPDSPSRLALHPEHLAEVKARPVPHSIRLPPKLPHHLSHITTTNSRQHHRRFVGSPRRFGRRRVGAGEGGKGEEAVELGPYPEGAEQREKEEEEEEEELWVSCKGREAVAGVPRSLLGGEVEAVERVNELRRHCDAGELLRLRPRHQCSKLTSLFVLRFFYLSF